jgi:hypothetical protein
MKKISLSKETLRVLTTQEAANVAGGALVTRRDDCNPTETRPATGCGTATGACPSAACPTNTCPTNGCTTTITAGCPPLSAQCPEPSQVCPESRWCPV